MAVLDNIEENVQEVIPENIDAMNRQSLKDRLLSYRRTPGSLIVMILVLLAAALTIAALLFLLVYILINGILTRTYSPGSITQKMYPWCPL